MDGDGFSTEGNLDGKEFSTDGTVLDGDGFATEGNLDGKELSTDGTVLDGDGFANRGKCRRNGLSTEGNLNLISAPCVRGIPLHRTWQGSCRWVNSSLNLDDVKIGDFRIRFFFFFFIVLSTALISGLGFSSDI